MKFNKVLFLYSFSMALFLCSEVSAANKSLTYTGHLTEPGGSAINTGNVTFTFSIYAPNGAHGNDCLLYRETQVVDMTNKAGTFSVRIGEGTRIAGYLQADLERVFQNTGTFPGLTCSSGSGNFQPAADEHRELGVSFLHGATTVALDRKVISSVPFASAVTGTANVNSFAIRNTTNNGQVALAAPSGAFTNYALTLPNALPGSTSLMKVSATGVVSFETLPTCGGTEFLQANGTGISCVAPSIGSGTVTSIIAGTGLTGGTITATGTIGLGTELAALNGVATTGFLQRTGAGAYSTVSTATMANTILPIQTGNSGEFLTTDGTNLAWAPLPAAGVTSLTGTANQISVSAATGAVTLSTPQNIHSAATPTFAGMTLSGLSTAGFVKNNASGVLSTSGSVNLASEVTGTLPIANGGTGQTTAAGALNALLPNQATNSGRFLTTDGTNTSWSVVPLADSSVTYAKLQNVAANSLVGNPTGGAAAATNVGLGSGLEFNSGNLRTINSATASGGNNTLVMRGAAGEVQSYSFDVAGSTSGIASIRAPTTFTNYVLTLPSDDGVANQVLQTNGSGVLSWVNQPTGVFTPGTDNTFVGVNAGDDVTVNAIGNTGVGRNALTALTGTATNDEGDYNTALGNGALSSATTAGVNVAVGSLALSSLVSNEFNVAVGSGSLGQVTSGGANTALGNRAGYRATTNSARNIFIGWNAGPTGDTNIYDSLYIHNDGSDYPLVGGRFDTRVLQSHGDFEIRPTTDSAGARQLRLYEGGAAWSNRVNIQAPALGADYTLTLPINDGDANQVLQTDGAGVLSWVSPASGGISALTGDVTASGSGSVAATITNSAVTYAKIQNVTDGRLLGNASGGAAAPSEITVGSGLSLSSGALTLGTVPFANVVSAGSADHVAVFNGSGALTSQAQLSVARGGTGASTLSTGQVLLGNGTSAVTATSGGSTGALLQQTVSGPAWTSALFPVSTSVNQILYSSSANVVAGLATANNGILTTNGSGVPSFLAAGTNGHVLTVVGGAPAWSAAPAAPNTDIDAATPFETSVGFEAGNSVAAGGLHNTFLGYQAGRLVSTGDYNIAIGSGALPVATDSTSNIAIGYRALESNTSSVENIAIGSEALLELEATGSDDRFNVAIGSRAAASLTTGSQNVAIGNSSLGGVFYAPVRSANSTAVGYQAMGSFVGFSEYTGNDSFGASSLFDLTTGIDNAAFGSEALVELVTGSENSAFGRLAGRFANGASSRNIFIGNQSGPTALGAVSDRLYIDVQASNTPLIYGEFDNNVVVINGRQVSSVIDAGAVTTIDFAASGGANVLRSTASGACTLAISGTRAGGNFSITMPNANQTCTLPGTVDGLPVETVAGYAAGTAVSGTGLVYSILNDGFNVWISWVPF